MNYSYDTNQDHEERGTHAKRCMTVMNRVGQNHMYTVYIRYFWLENHQIYGVYTRIYTVLANPSYEPQLRHRPGSQVAIVQVAILLVLTQAARIWFIVH